MSYSTSAAIDAAAQASADNWGRIHKTAFIVVLSILWAFMMLAFCIRIYVRVLVQKQFSWDDGIICVGVASFIAGAGITFYQVEQMFLGGALLSGDRDIGISSDIIWASIGYNEWSAISLTLLWFSIFCVKISFLLLFRKLVDRMRRLTIYWWVVLVYTIIVFMGGTSSYFAPCPYFDNLKAITCSNGSQVQLTFKTSLSQNIADIIGDCLIVAIPIILISKIQVRWTQKIALSLSLCLTVVLIAVTIIRASGIKNSAGDIDVVWNVFWQVVSSELGLILACALVFRTFFVGKNNASSNGKRRGRWYSPKLYWIREFFSRRTLFSKRSTDQARKKSYSSRENRRADLSGGTAVDEDDQFLQMPELPRATMTGMRTFIGKNNKTNWDHSGIMMTRSYNVDEEQAWGMPQQQPEPSHDPRSYL